MSHGADLAMLIQEQETPGIVPFFWKDQPQDDDLPAMIRIGTM